MTEYNLSIISYYGPVETILLAQTALENKLNRKIYNFPLFKYMHDKCDKVNNYEELLINFIKDNNITHLLWWFINIDTEKFINIKKETNVKYLFFNWDEPYNWLDCDIQNKMKFFDSVFVTCQETLQVYKDNGCNEAYCLYPGFSEEKNYMIKDIDIDKYNKYNCDISFCCTNLYSDEKIYPNQYICRKTIVDNIYLGQDDNNYKFYIYGPEFLKELYPKSYRGFAKYNELNDIFNYSKINLCTHVQNDKGGYINERVILIGASGGLILVDYVKDIEKVFDINNEILVLDKHFYVRQICEILDKYDKYIEIRKNMNKKCLEKYNYDVWAKFIVDKLLQI